MSLVNVKRKERKHNFKPHLTVILSKMCEFSGVPMRCVPFNEDRWWSMFSWTEEDEKEFEKWLSDYYYRNFDARQELWKYNSPRPSKKKCKGVASEFIFNYGWVYKKENDG